MEKVILKPKYEQTELYKKKIEWLLKNGTSKNKNEDDAARHANNAEKCLRWAWVATEMPGHSYLHRNHDAALWMPVCSWTLLHGLESPDKVIDLCHGVADKESLKVRRIYAREVKELKLVQRFRGQEEQQDRSQEGR